MSLVKVDVETIALLPGPGFEQDQLEAAFGEVTKDVEHWKDALNCWVPVEDLDLVRAAVIHFTGSVIEEVDFDEMSGRVRIHAAGYWAVIGA